MFKTKIFAITLVAALALLAGCSKGESESLKVTESAPTSSSTTTTTPTVTLPKPPAQEPGREHLTVEHDHCGLHFKLDDTYTVGLEDGNKNIFTFANDKINGTVTFGKLSELGNGAKDSQEYANLLFAQYDEESAFVGTSTGFGYYVIHTLENSRTAEILYIHGEYAWLVKAEIQGTDSVDSLIQVIGRCGLNAEEIPVE